MASAGQITLSVLGIVGLSGIVSAIRSSRRLSRHHRFFRFRSGELVDMVLPTSDRTEGGRGVRYMRTVTSVGNLKGSTEIAQAIGYGSLRRPILVSVSAELESPLDGDLVLIGLPGKNDVSRLVLARLVEHHPELRLAIDETDGSCRMSLGELSEEYAVHDQPGCAIPERDLALIVLWVNPLSVEKRRLIWCAGFTAYGTAAAASYLVDEIVRQRIGPLGKQHPALPSLWSCSWICFAMVVEARLVNDQVVEVRERAFVPLQDPGRPPFDD